MKIRVFIHFIRNIHFPHFQYVCKVQLWEEMLERTCFADAVLDMKKVLQFVTHSVLNDLNYQCYSILL